MTFSSAAVEDAGGGLGADSRGVSLSQRAGHGQRDGKTMAQSNPNHIQIVGKSLDFPPLYLACNCIKEPNAVQNLPSTCGNTGPVKAQWNITLPRRDRQNMLKKKYVHRLAKWRSNTSLKSSCFCAPDITALQFG